MTCLQLPGSIEAKNFTAPKATQEKREDGIDDRRHFRVHEKGRIGACTVCDTWHERWHECICHVAKREMEEKIYVCKRWFLKTNCGATTLNSALVRIFATLRCISKEMNLSYSLGRLFLSTLDHLSIHRRSNMAVGLEVSQWIWWYAWLLIGKQM